MLLYKKKYIVVFLLFVLTLSSCGSKGCKYPEDTREGGIWENSLITTVRPINKNIIKSETADGAYVIYEGTTESKARENLWVPMKLGNGDYATVKAGNKVRMNIDGSVILSGAVNTIDIRLKQMLTVDGSRYSSSESKKTKKNFANIVPEATMATTKFKQDGKQENEYSFEIDIGSGVTKNVVENTNEKENKAESVNNSCRISTQSSNETINYAFYFVKKIVFDYFPKISGTSISLVNNVIINDPSCGVENDGKKLWYFCDFTYNNEKYKYRRRITPVKSGRYVNFEEQIVSITHPLKYTLDSNVGNDNPTNYDCDKYNKESSDFANCVRNFKNSTDRQQSNKLDDTSKRLYYLMCIKSGDISMYPESSNKGYSTIAPSGLCSDFNGKDANNSNENYYDNNNHNNYRHIIYSTTHSPIRVYFKTHSEIFNSVTTKTYNAEKCFKKQTSYYLKNTLKSDNNTYKYRLMSDMNNITCSDGTKITYPTLCRIFPKSIKYNLHKINIKESNWITTNGTPNDIERCSRDCIDLCATYFKEDNTLSNMITCNNNNWCIGNDKKFARYVPIDYDESSINNKTIASTSCGCTNIGHSFQTIARNNNNYRSKIANICSHTNGGWYGLYATSTNPSISSGILNYAVVGKAQNGSTYSGSFTMAKILTYYNGGTNSGVKISYGICSPYAKNKEYCDEIEKQEQCGKKPFCTSMGRFTFDANYENNYGANCPGTCQSFTYKDDGVSNTSGTITDLRSMNRIDYRNSDQIATDMIRKGTENYDGNNTFYYVLNENENDIYPAGADIPVKNGFLPITSDEVISIDCSDIELPVSYFETSTSITKKPEDFDIDSVSDSDLQEAGYTKQDLLSTFQNDNCKVSGYFTELELTNNVVFSKNKRGIIPPQYANFAVKTGASIPIKVSSTYPIKVKTNDCLNENDPYCYVELRGGHGLVAFIQEEDEGYGAGYSDTDMWQCNMGGGGSYAKYRPYDYSNSYVKGTYNPRQIATSNNLWWECDDPITIWFSGYDFINVKTGKPVQFHRYNVKDLTNFLPNFTMYKEEQEDTSVDSVGCNSNGIPSKMIIDGKTIEGKDIVSITYNETDGAQYAYNDEGAMKTISIYDPRITKKFYQDYSPHLITANLPDLGLDFVTLTNVDNNLKREYESQTTKLKAYYTFKYNEVEYSIGNGAIPIESDNITFASCYNKDEKPKAQTLSETALQGYTTNITELKLDENSKFYRYNKKEQTIFTRYGPFTGFADNAMDIVSPAVYQTQGMCRGPKDYNRKDEIGSNSSETNVKPDKDKEKKGNGKQFVYDEQHGKSPEKHKHVSKYMGYPHTNTPRYNLSKSWRLEFTTPKMENTTTDETNTEEDTGTNSVCHNYSNTTLCEIGEVPDIMIVDLSNTEEYINNNKRDNTGTKVLYKDENSISYEDKDYYVVKSSLFGNNDYEIMVKDKMVQSITCDGFENCNANEIPTIKITKGGKMYVLVSENQQNIETGENEMVITSSISTRKTRTYYTFDYQTRNYTIREDKVGANDTICIKSSSYCKSYLSQYVTNFTHSQRIIGKKNDNELYQDRYYYNMDRAPYIITCGNNQEGTEASFRNAYTNSITTNLKDSGGEPIVEDKYVVGADFSKSALVMQSNIKNFTTRDTFARCVPSWVTPRWMLLSQPGKPSTFETGFTPISGSIFLSQYDTININDFSQLDNRYHFKSTWKKYGGIITNTITKESCSSSECFVADETIYNAEFKTSYDRQFIFVKPLINDPINTSDTDCEIDVQIDGKSNKTYIKMNDPFGSLLPSSDINGEIVDKTVKNEDDVDISDEDIKVQPLETANGDGKRYQEFFKKSEAYRNLVGAGYFYPEWQIVGTKQNGQTSGILIGKDTNIKFVPNGKQYYYITGNLSHSAQAYCAIDLSVAQILRETIYATALAVTASGGVLIGVGIAKIAAVVTLPAGIALVASGVVLITVVSPCIMMLAVSASNKSKDGADTKGVMKIEYPIESKRKCGVGTAFKVVQFPKYACINGYKLKCTNDRINKKYTTPEDIIEKCKSSAQTHIRTDPVSIGRCYKVMYNIDSGIIEGEKIQRYRSSSQKYLNTLIDSANTWDENENIYDIQCGLCVRTEDIYSYNGIYYLIGSIPEIPHDILSSDACISHTGEGGENYTWVTNIGYVKSFDEYTGTTKNAILNSVKDKFLETITNDNSCEKEINFSPSLTNDDNYKTIKTAYLKASIRDMSSCISYISSLYDRFLSEIKSINDDCRTNVELKIEPLASAVCSQFKSRVANDETLGGNHYFKYKFIQNQAIGSCVDDKDQYVEKTNKNGFLPLTRINNEKMITQYGYGELSSDNVNDLGTATFTLNVPKSKKSGNTARIGFAFAGNDTDDPLDLYQNYRIDNEDDLQRGYQITMGSGNLLTGGKHLYYYIQPYNDQNEPDPNFDPNVIFSPSKSGLTIDQIIQNEGVYSYKAWDVKGNGSALITMPRDGKLWLAILDSAEATNGETDGQYIMFNEDNSEGELKTAEGNYSGTNSGFYDVSGSIQTENLDAVDSIVGSAKNNNGFASHTIFSAIIISPLKTILLGGYNKEQKTYNWEKGVLGQLSASFMKSHLLYIAWYLLAVFSMFVLAFGYLSGNNSVKLDFEFIRKYLWRYALIMAFVNPYSYDLYTKLFVKNTFALAEGLSAYAVGSFSSSTYNDLSPAGFTAVAFGPIDEILRYWFRMETVEKMLAILFSSWTGWCCCLILILCFILFMLSAIEALALYVIILIKMSLYLAVGPIVFITLLHESTSSKFYDWLKSLAGMIAEMVAMFTAVGIFATIYYHILKGSLNFIYCWEPIIKIPLLNITLLSMWRIAGTLPAHMAELMGYNGSGSAISQGFNLINGFELLIITMMMSKFVDKASSFGAKLFGQSSSMPSSVKQTISGIKQQMTQKTMDKIKAPVKFVKDKITGEEKKDRDK